MKIIYKYSKKGKQTNKQKTKDKRQKPKKNSMDCQNQLTLIYSIDQTNKSNLGFLGYYMNQKISKYKKNSMECKNQKLFEGSEPTKHIKVKNTKNRSFLWIAETKKL